MYQDNFYVFDALYSLSEVEVGKHLYLEIAGLKVHGQVFIVTWLCMAALIGFAIVGTRDLKQAPQGLQNFMEYVYEFLSDIAKNQIGEHDYRPWVPYVSTVFLFIFAGNWAGALIPWKLIQLPEGELAAPTNDINTTVAFSIINIFLIFLCRY